ncbi:MAG: PD40 domain-containing protein [Planctomycetes bacterium]|nr:PD40 domain-containing protein [Planctomycetota bacterium]
MNIKGGWVDSPHISLDGKKLYFMYTPWDGIAMMQGKLVKTGPVPKGHHRSEFSDDSDIYVSHLGPKNAWGPWQNLLFNDIRPDHSGMPTNNGFIYVKSETDAHHDLEIYQVFFNSKTNKGSLKPQRLPAPINSKFDEDNPFLSRDSRTLIFESNRPKGQGGYDLYLCHKPSKGQWSSPKPFPANINTKANESQAFLSANGKELYFNRDRPEQGDTRIFYARSIGRNKWSTPIMLELGHPLVGEASLTADGKFLYFLKVNPANTRPSIMFCQRENGKWSKAKPVD